MSAHAALPPATRLLARSPLAGLDPDDVAGEWEHRGLADLSDAALVELAAVHVAVPRRDPADSFVLHAPLELMARSALLRHVPPAARRQARQRLAWVAATYERHEPIESPGPAAAATAASPERLRAALVAGDLDEVDRQAVALATTTTATELVALLADLIVDRLGAAAHGAIFLYHLPRLLAADATAPLLARGLLREIARRPDWALSWMDRREAAVVPTRDLRDRLLGHPHVGDPGSIFIYPTMSAVERAGLADEVLASPTLGLGAADARRDLLRVAAWSMLQDDPAHAPYGWSHALTMPQATLGIADACGDPGRAVAVAATYVLGFRATLGRVGLDPGWVPERRHPPAPAELLVAGPGAAAAALWHAPDDALAPLVTRVLTYAAHHEDAHVAKYALACLDATRDDPAVGRLYLAAAAYLAGWWHERGD